jgi:menaquinol-cytochrome c reductase iron-sulfur subunit
MESSEEKDKRLINRRTFFKWGSGILSVAAATIFGIPLIGSLFNSKPSSKGHFIKIADLNALPTEEPKHIIFSELVTDAFLVETETSDIWVIKHSESDITVFSPICPHLGCKYDWLPSKRQFVCPCHSSVFSMDGKVISGPSPRKLDTLPQKIENGELFVQSERYEIGISEKKTI